MPMHRRQFWTCSGGWVRNRNLQGTNEGKRLWAERRHTLSHAGTGDHLRVLLKEEDSVDEFVSGEYQETLRMLAEEGSRSLSDEKEIANLRETLHEHDIDVSFSHILLELLDVQIDGQQDNDALRQNLLEFAATLSDRGVYSIIAIFDRAQRGWNGLRSCAGPAAGICAS